MFARILNKILELIFIGILSYIIISFLHQFAKMPLLFDPSSESTANFDDNTSIIVKDDPNEDDHASPDFNFLLDQLLPRKPVTYEVWDNKEVKREREDYRRDELRKLKEARACPGYSISDVHDCPPPNELAYRLAILDVPIKYAQKICSIYNGPGLAHNWIEPIYREVGKYREDSRRRTEERRQRQREITAAQVAASKKSSSSRRHRSSTSGIGQGTLYTFPTYPSTPSSTTGTTPPLSPSRSLARSDSDSSLSSRSSGSSSPSSSSSRSPRPSRTGFSLTDLVDRLESISELAEYMHDVAVEPPVVQKPKKTLKSITSKMLGLRTTRKAK